MSKYTYTEDQLREAVSTSFSIRQVLQKLNIIAAGGNYRTLHKLIEKLSIDTSHFTGMLWSKGKKLPYLHLPIEDYLTNKKPIQSHKLKLKLIEAKIKENRCEICKLTLWLDKPIPVELDHIDGNHMDNRLENLRILCPNCHAQTGTYRGKNKKSTKLSSALPE